LAFRPISFGPNCEELSSVLITRGQPYSNCHFADGEFYMSRILVASYTTRVSRS